MSGSSVWALVVVALAIVWAGGGAEAQPSGGPFDMPGRVPEQNRLALAVDEGKALALEARFVPGGMYYAAVRITVANPSGTSADRVYARASAFRLITAQGAILHPRRRRRAAARRGLGGQPMRAHLPGRQPPHEL